MNENTILRIDTQVYNLKLYFVRKEKKSKQTKRKSQNRAILKMLVQCKRKHERAISHLYLIHE